MSKIELSENSVTILDHQELTDRHILFIKVDIDGLSASKAKKYMEDVQVAFAKTVEPATLIVAPLGTELELYKKVEK